MLPGATLPAARYYVTPGQRRRSCAARRPAPRRGAHGKRQARMRRRAWLRCWRCRRSGRHPRAGSSFPGLVRGSWRAGRCQARRPGPTWTTETWQRPDRRGAGRVREGKGLGLAWRCSRRRCWMRRWPGCRPSGHGRSRHGWRCRWASRGPDARHGCGDAPVLAPRPREADPDITFPRRRRCRTWTASSRSSRSCGCWPGSAGRSAPSRCPASRRCACRRRGRRRAAAAMQLRPLAAGHGGTAAGTGCGAGQGWHHPQGRRPRGPQPQGAARSPATPRTSAGQHQHAR